jgi:hypothetical protein
LAQTEHGIERGMAIARGHVEQPTAVRLLVPQHALDDFVCHRRGFSDEPMVVSRVKRRGDVIIQIAVRRLHHRGANAPVRLRRNGLPIGHVGERKEARGIGRQRFVVLLQDFLEHVERIVARPGSERPQSDQALGRVIDPAFRGFGIHRSRQVEKITVRLLARKEEMARRFLVGKLPSKRFVQRHGVGHSGQIAVSAVRHSAICRIDAVGE